MIKHPKYRNGNIYLSGGMQFAEDLGGAWREECAKTLRKLAFYPLDITALDKEYTKLHGDLYHSYENADKHLLQIKSNLRKHFIYTDCELIEKDSDAVVLYYDESVRKGAGTLGEAQITYTLGLPLFIVNSFKDINEVPEWLIGLSTKIFNTFDELYEYLSKLPEGIICRDTYGNTRSGDQYLCSLCGDPFKKKAHHFVSKISPLYCSTCVDVITTTYESHKDRYEFFMEVLERESTGE